MKTSDILKENVSNLATKLPTADVINLVAEHMWHEYFSDRDVTKFFNKVKQKVAENKNRSQPKDYAEK